MIKLIKSAFFNEAQTRTALSRFILEAPAFSMGEQCRQFELAFANAQDRKFAVFVGSGSAANLVLIQALLNLGRLGRGDVVGVSTLTWSTNIMPLLQLGLKPWPVDCSLSTLNISPEQLKPELGKLRALFLTNVLGFSDKIDQISGLCREAGVVLLEDNCESLGSRVAGKLLGNFGAASTFSFYIGHHMSTIEGGMVCTDDPELAEMLVMVRAHGWDRNLPPEAQKRLRAKFHINDFFDKYTFYDLAVNARPNEINGFIGSQQISYLPEIISARATNFKEFQAAAADNNDILPLSLEHMDVVSNFAMPLVFRDEAAFKRYQGVFHSRDVEIRPIIAGDITRQPFYRKYVSESRAFPNAAQIHSQGLYFGNNPDMTGEEKEVLTDILRGNQ